MLNNSKDIPFLFKCSSCFILEQEGYLYDILLIFRLLLQVRRRFFLKAVYYLISWLKLNLDIICMILFYE